MLAPTSEPGPDTSQPERCSTGLRTHVVPPPWGQGRAPAGPPGRTGEKKLPPGPSNGLGGRSSCAKDDLEKPRWPISVGALIGRSDLVCPGFPVAALVGMFQVFPGITPSKLLDGGRRDVELFGPKGCRVFPPTPR